ncbi:hypothetical protein D3C77_472340 [compost metagenome]
MKQITQEMIDAGEPLLQQATEALRRLHEAEAAGKALDEVERLRLLAESLWQAVSEYQLRALSGQVRPLQ